MTCIFSVAIFHFRLNIFSGIGALFAKTTRDGLAKVTKIFNVMLQQL